MTEKRKPIYYVENKRFLQAMIVYLNACKAAEAEGVQLPKIPDYIGECIFKIAQGLSHKGNFINYSYREEMIGDGIESCVKYIRSFNPEKSSNPFAYFTQILYNAYIHRIQKEKKQQYIKYKSMERHIIHDMQGDDYEFYTQQTDNTDAINNVIISFEASLEKKKNNIKKGLELFVSEEEIEDVRDITTDHPAMDTQLDE
jgi:hypothetical protein